MPKGIEAIEEQDAQAKHSIFTYFVSLLFAFSFFPSIPFTSFITAFAGYLLNLQISVFKNISFSTPKEQKQVAKDLDNHYTLYIKGFEDLLKQSIKKDDAETEAKCRSMLEALKTTQNTFRVKNKWLDGNKSDYLVDMNI